MSSSPEQLQRTTLRTIAKQAGTSVSAVSSVLNGLEKERRISTETVHRIQAAIQELGYLPNISARKLRRGSGSSENLTIALITSYEAPLPLIGHFVVAFRKITAENQTSLHAYTFSLTIEMFHAGRLRELPGILNGTHFNAAIITNTTPEDDRFLEENRLPYPTVLVNRSIEGYTSVSENIDSGAIAAKALLQQGRRHLAVVAGNPLTQTTKRRIHTFSEETERQGQSAALSILSPDLLEENAFSSVRHALSIHPEIDGLYTVSDSLALGAYQAVKSLGKKIAKEIGIVSVGDYQLSPFFDPPLSTVGVSPHRLASEATLQLLSKLNNPKQPPSLIIVPLSPQIQTEIR
jgi:LacI family transcriptional regulator